MKEPGNGKKKMQQMQEEETNPEAREMNHIRQPTRVGSSYK